MTVNYRDTLNLPNTDFSMKAGLPRKEPEILDFWEKTNLYKKIRHKYEGKELFLTS
jgi:isoleucyl-tRNA synthetase